MEGKKGSGIQISTKNISYCTVGMYKNALATAGLEDAEIIVAGPFPISGTAALIGALQAYSKMTGDEIKEESLDTAMNELGMFYAKESQIIYYSVGDDDYMNQFGEIPGK